ncbi:YbaY family lipoprotein [Pseudomonas guariconensis]|uniref:YbaY family lipoprotein n=1 Tax=Pseudomonas TaxID=286 RepID=UPI001CE48EEE|nr:MULTISPECIES: YbaY family lipoprotein [Pseudomonas]MCO7638845.1 YbaY family lipoprotein [Pseudomonas sp. S 311-6]MCO7513398.1 YbaY family lipoprotein [Pseudomonas putida]MCO7564566.1 YbaY family lipoprotein [Pseudomonas mosselii]MCO7596444.1 YbaY family lipoprotein [Pseudomonas guariconensis]MCO7604042.1 YbaY family lipoprotein [Pseudomonas guariconensis]
MHQRALVVLCFAGLLAACGSDRPKTEQPPVAPPAKAAKQSEDPGPLPAYQRELSGTLLEIPAGAEVELALLVIDERGRPQRLLASSNLTGTGQPMPYRLRFNPEAFPAGARVELRGRASRSGQLILHLPAQRIFQATTQATGPLRFQKAP